MGYIKRYYDDSEVREFAKKFVKDVFNLNFESHKNLRGIDLINVEDNTFGIELEKGGWYGDFWENDYSLISGEEFRTVNIPIRKTKYWYDKKDGELFPNKKTYGTVKKNNSKASINNKNWATMTEYFKHDYSIDEATLLRLLVLHQFINEHYI
jgi:hypothetical protein